MCERSQLPICATTFLIPLIAYTALTSALFPNAAPPAALLLQLLMAFLSAMTVAFCNLDLAQTEWLWILDQKIEVGNVCAVITHEELPYVAWFITNGPWRCVRNGCSPSCPELRLKARLHGISSCTLSIRLGERSRKCTDVHVHNSGGWLRKHLLSLLITWNAPAVTLYDHSGSVFHLGQMSWKLFLKKKNGF